MALASCGGGSSVSHTSTKQVQAELRSKLKTYHYRSAGVPNVFVTPAGKCAVSAVFTGAALTLNKNRPTILLSPDGTAGLDISNTLGQTSEGYCMTYAANALGWK